MNQAGESLTEMLFLLEQKADRNSSVGKATELRAGRSGSRIPVGARVFAHVQTGPGAHPASCTMGTRSFPGVKRLGRDADHTPPSSSEVTKD
jgi:hypothetical protein